MLINSIWALTILIISWEHNFCEIKSCQNFEEMSYLVNQIQVIEFHWHDQAEYCPWYATEIPKCVWVQVLSLSPILDHSTQHAKFLPIRDQLLDFEYRDSSSQWLGWCIIKVYVWVWCCIMIKVIKARYYCNLNINVHLLMNKLNNRYHCIFQHKHTLDCWILTK